MEFKGIDTNFFESYRKAFSFLPTAQKNIKSGLYTGKDQYCNDIFIGCWLHPFFAVGVITGIILDSPMWWFELWFGVNILLFHPDIRLV